MVPSGRNQDTDAILERLADQLGLRIHYRHNGKAELVGPDGEAVPTFREDYPYPTKLRRRAYEKEKRALQIELLKLQRSVRSGRTGWSSCSRAGTRRARAARSSASPRT